MRGVLLVVVVLLVGLRLALPSMVQKYVNRKLDELPEYDGHVGQVDIHLWRGAYAVDYVRIVKTEGKVTEPLFEELDVVSLKQDRNPFEIVWEGLVAGLVKLFKNQREDRFATQMPVSGNFDNPDVAVWRTIVNVLRNAFVEALPARIEGIITPDAVQEKER